MSVAAQHLPPRLLSQTITLAQATEAGLLFILIVNRKGFGDIGDTSNTPPLHSHSSEDSNTPENTQKCPFQLWEGACTHRSHLSDAQNKVAPSEPPAHGANHQHQHCKVPWPHSAGEGCRVPCSLLVLPVPSLPTPQACWDLRSLAKACARPWAQLERHIQAHPQAQDSTEMAVVSLPESPLPSSSSPSSWG